MKCPKMQNLQFCGSFVLLESQMFSDFVIPGSNGEIVDFNDEKGSI